MRAAVFLVALLAAVPTLANAQVSFVPPGWPCHDDGPPSPEQAALINQMRPDLATIDREFFPDRPGTASAMNDVDACQAEADPDKASAIAQSFGYPPDWTKVDRKQAAAVAELQRQQNTQRTSRPAEDYLSQLKKKYSSRLTFSTSRAAEIVAAFDIDCRSRDRRYLPLMNVLYARLAAMDSDKVWVITNVDNRGDEVRIVDSYMGKNGQLVPPRIAFVITKWDELQPLEMTTEALMNLCYGSYGPLWVVPTE